MNIILLENIEKVGLKYEVVTVKAGYGRNYLIPQGLALTANRQNLGKLSGIKRQQAAKDNAQLDTFKGWAAALQGKTIRFVVKAGDSGRLFGSITSNMMAEKLAELGAPVERRRIIMPAEVKMLGSYEVKLDLHSSLDVRVPFEVVSESENMVYARGVAADSAAEAAAAAPVVVETVAEKVEAAAPVAIAAAAVAAPTILETVTETASSALESVQEFAAPAVETVSEAAESAVESVKEFAAPILEDVADAAESAFESIKNVFSSEEETNEKKDGDA